MQISNLSKAAVGLLIAVMAMIVAFAVGVGDVAHADPTTVKSDLKFSGSGPTQDLGGIFIHCDPCLPDILISNADEATVGGFIEVNTSVDWTAPVSIETNYDADQLQQGTTVDLSNSLTPGAGTIKINYNIPFAVGIFAKGDDFPDDGPLPGGWSQTGSTIKDKVNLSTSTACTPPLAGKPDTVCAVADVIPIVTSPKFLDFAIGFDLVISHAFTIGPAGITSHRIVGSSADDLTFVNPVPSVVDDSFDVPCNTQAGESIQYSLTQNQYTPSVKVSGTLGLRLRIQIPILPDFSETFNFINGNVYNQNLKMTGSPDPNFNLGIVSKDKDQPEIKGIDIVTASPAEGKPILFAADANDNCLAPNELHYKWSFSDGGVGFGPVTTHTFADNGLHSGTVRVTDDAGNENAFDFLVSVGNQAPAVAIAADPAKVVWGVPVEFSANATDPSPVDQENLTYSWDFGDGGTAFNQKVTHTFDAPGDYAVTLTVTDDKESTSQTVEFAVNNRGTNIKYDGPIKREANDSANEVVLSARLVDELGDPVKGVPLQFRLGDVEIINTTDGNGAASASLPVPDGDTNVEIEFKGNGSHKPSLFSKPFSLHPNEPPIVSPLPNPAKEVWGVDIEFSGFATDPDGGAQDTLKYAWDFGDENGAINPKVSHAYDKPGEYRVVLTVTDKDGASAQQETTVTVNKRDTAIKQCGDVQVSAEQRSTDLCAGLIDSEGDVVIGRTVDFTIEVELPSLTNNGLTDANGEVRTAANVNLTAGCFVANIDFDGSTDNLYNSSDYDYVFYVTAGGRGTQICELGLAGVAGFDVNCDGSTNSIDAMYVLQVIAGLIAYTSCENVANVNGDGVIDPLDALYLLQHEAGISGG